MPASDRPDDPAPFHPAYQLSTSHRARRPGASRWSAARFGSLTEPSRGLR